MWQSTPQQQGRHVGFPPEYFFVAPASSFHQNETHFEQQNHHHSLNASIGVIPLLTATPCLAPNDDDNAAALKLWQQHGQSSTYLKKVADVNNHGTSVVSNNSSLGTATCQDCGNQAKKDCPHRRCRTCCKSRGYDCSTHVKSTWVPVARRRERQLLGVNATPTGGGGSSQSNSSAKRARLAGGASQTTSHTSTSNTTPPRSFDASSSHQDASFKESLPGQVRAPATFKCVRVTAVDDGDDEYAYQAVVNIGGHVFKGFLYDQGVEGGKEAFPNMSELHLGGGRNVTSSSGLDPSGIYGAASGGGLLGGSNYGNQIN